MASGSVAKIPLLPLLVAGLSCISVSCGAGGSDIGQGSAGNTQNVPAAPVLGWTPPDSPQGFTPPVKTIPTGPSGSVLDYGAKCDGVNDDRVAVQRALDTLVVIQFPAGATCVVYAAAKTVRFFNTEHHYALSVPSNRAIYLNGTTIKLGNGQNAHLFINADMAGGGNHDIAFLGPGTFDLNKANQTSPGSGEQSGGFMDLVTDLTMRDIVFKNVRQYALRHFRIIRGYYDQLVCTDSDGSGFAFGVEYAGGPTESYFGHLEGHNASGTASQGSVGNPFIGYGANNVLKTFVGTGNRFGFKLQDGASNWTIGSIQIRGTTGDRAVKIMGMRAGTQTQRISIGSIETSGNYYEGLYVWESDDIAIGKVVSIGDATSGNSPGVTLMPNAGRIVIGSVSVQGAKATGLSIEGTDIEIGEIFARDNGVLTGGQSNVAIRSTAQRVKIGSLVSVDDQKPSRVRFGLNVMWGSTDVDVQSMLPVGSFLTGPTANAGYNSRIADYKDRFKVFVDGDTTPSVSDGTLFKTANSKPTTITTFTEGAVGKEITILCGDANTNVFNGSGISLTAPLSCVPGNVFRLAYDGSTWNETGRSTAPAPPDGTRVGAALSGAALAPAGIGLVIRAIGSPGDELELSAGSEVSPKSADPATDAPAQ